MISTFIYSHSKSSDTPSFAMPARSRGRDLSCLYPVGVYTKSCVSGHNRKVALRCRNKKAKPINGVIVAHQECFPCHKHRVIKVRMELKRRITHVKSSSKTLTMWTFGTSLDDTKENRKKILNLWRNFMKYVRRSGKNTFVFYTIESGNSGHLHIHAICRSFYAHTKFLAKWRSQAKEEANVNFKARRWNTDKVMNYLTKYLTKDTDGFEIIKEFQYYWLGEYRNLKAPLHPAICNVQYLDGTFCRYYVWRYTIHDDKLHDDRSRSLDDFPFCRTNCRIFIPKSGRHFGGFDIMFEGS